MFHPPIIFRIIGLLLLFEATALSGCMGLSLYYGERIVMAYIETLLCLIGLGLLLVMAGRKAKREISKKDGYIVVTLCWLIFSAFAGMPYYFSGYIPNVTDAFFEAVSGFTTTGASIIDNLEEFPYSLLFWRSMTQWIGGLGIVFFTVAILPFWGMGNVPLLAAESVGPIRMKLHPQIAVTTRWILAVYIILTLAETICLMVAGMNLFEAVCHSMATVSTGGFSTRQASIAAFQSPAIEYIVTVFMFLGGTNLSLLYLSMIKGRPGKLLADKEFRTYSFIVFMFVLLLTVGLLASEPMGIEEAFRISAFQTVTIITTTGFCMYDYMLWMPLLWLMVSLLMYIGACTGSTTGGIKCVRIRILGRIIGYEFKKMMHPNLVSPIKLGDKVIQERIVISIVAFILIYLLMIVLGMVVNMACGLDFLESYGLSLTSLGNVGPGLGYYGPANTMSSLPDVAKWFSCFQMLVGRLEFFAVFVLFTPAFWNER